MNLGKLSDDAPTTRKQYRVIIESADLEAELNKFAREGFEICTVLIGRQYHDTKVIMSRTVKAGGDTPEPDLRQFIDGMMENAK